MAINHSIWWCKQRLYGRLTGCRMYELFEHYIIVLNSAVNSGQAVAQYIEYSDSEEVTRVRLDHICESLCVLSLVGFRL